MIKQQLKRDITVIVSIKVLIVIAAAFFVFGPRQRPHIDDDTVRAQLLNNTPSDRDNRSQSQ
jgi:hypothetical protein